MSVRGGDRKIRPEDRRLASLVMTNGDPEGRIFLTYPHTNNGFFFLLTTVFIYSFIYFKITPSIIETGNSVPLNRE